MGHLCFSHWWAQSQNGINNLFFLDRFDKLVAPAIQPSRQYYAKGRHVTCKLQDYNSSRRCRRRGAAERGHINISGVHQCIAEYQKRLPPSLTCCFPTREEADRWPGEFGGEDFWNFMVHISPESQGVAPAV